jgi:hypothetical protein
MTLYALYGSKKNFDWYAWHNSSGIFNPATPCNLILLPLTVSQRR